MASRRPLTYQHRDIEQETSETRSQKTALPERVQRLLKTGVCWIVGYQGDPHGAAEKTEDPRDSMEPVIILLPDPPTLRPGTKAEVLVSYHIPPILRERLKTAGLVRGTLEELFRDYWSFGRWMLSDWVRVHTAEVGELFEHPDDYPAGIIAAKGARVRGFRIGDRVWATSTSAKGGFYAEYVAVDARHAAHIPRRLDLLHAAAAPATGLTALRGIDDVLRVRPGETVLIFGASGAVGTLAVQFAKHRRARVLAAIRGRDATALVRRLGANAVIDTRRGDAPERLRRLAPDGIDAVLALAGGQALERCLRFVRPGGRMAYPYGVEPEPRRRQGIRLRAFNAATGPREFARLERAAVAARIRVPIAAVYPLAEAARAHARLERGHVLGRIVLRISRRNR